LVLLELPLAAALVLAVLTLAALAVLVAVVQQAVVVVKMALVAREQLGKVITAAWAFLNQAWVTLAVAAAVQALLVAAL
jgi:hypothetical protein